MTGEGWPLVSVIMPVRNEADFIARSLGAVLAQDYPPDCIEVLVADGRSTDDTLVLIRALPGAERVRIVDNPERIQAHGLNRAIPLARGEIIIRVDGHTIIAPDYVRQCVEALRRTGADSVGGGMDPVGITPTGRAIAAAGKSAFGVPTAFHVSDQAQYTDTVYMGAWPRGVFERVGLFRTDVGVNEDYELNYRIRAAGGRIYFEPAIRSQYYARQSFAALARQYFRYGRGRVRTLRLHPESLRARQVVAPAFVAGLILGPWHPRPRPLWIICIVLYGLLNGFFSLRAVRRVEGAAVWRVKLVFLTMHLAWGAGFWRELLRPD